MYTKAYKEYLIFEADKCHLDHLRVFSEDGSRVGVQVVEGDKDTKTLRYLDTKGYLSIEQVNGNVALALKFYKLPADEILEKLITPQDRSSD